MNPYVVPALLLTLSNSFMTFAWYCHLKYGHAKPLWLIVLASWGIAFFEYCFMVPANRLGYDAGLSAGKLKVLQEAITMVVFIVFAKLYLAERIPWNYYVGFLLVLAGVAVVNLGKA